jgi:hypothetical protein
MGDRRPAESGQRQASSQDGDLFARVISQSPALYITLVSVLVGLVLSDLVTEARSRMHLWPLDMLALRTWGQLTSNGSAALAVWTILAHLSIARRRAPHLTETLFAFGPPLLVLATTSFVGRAEMWPWLYGAAGYLVIAAVTDIVNVRMTMDQPGGERFAPLLDPRRHMSIVFLAIPLYGVGGYLDQHGRLSPTMELALAALPMPTTLLVVWVFFHDWRKAVGAG